MVFSNPNRRASIQRVPCSHKSEYRRLYKSSVMNAGSALATVSVVGGSFPTLTRTWSRSLNAVVLMPANHCASASRSTSSSFRMIGIWCLGSSFPAVYYIVNFLVHRMCMQHRLHVYLATPHFDNTTRT